MKTQIISVLLFLLILPCTMFGQYNMEATIPMDPNVKIGKLKNGMTYYIRKNSEPKERANFYIIQNVGSLLENDDQNGLAHFLEHMAFNGTKHFPDASLKGMLERNGVAFGSDLNAYTTHNETVYNMNNVQTTNAALMDSCLLILYDWSHYLLLEDKEIDNERGVISEEWRTRLNSDFRLMNKISSVVFKGSQYAKRNVIGDLDIIKNFTYQTIRDFYHDWYRTDLQAIAIVGDFDVKVMEQKVIDLFSKIPAVKKAKKRPFFEIPAHDKANYVLATDPEAQSSTITIYMKQEDRHVSRKNKDIRNGLINSLYSSMINSRISELLQKGNPPFVQGGISYSKLTRGYETYYISVVTKNNEEELALRSIMTENERVVRHGFTSSELEREKKNILTNVESAYKQRDKRNNDYFIRQIKNHYLEQYPIMDIEYYYNFVKSELPKITAEEVWAKVKEWCTYKNMTVVVTGPSENSKHLSEEEAMNIIDEVKKADIQPYQDNVVDSELINYELNGGTITATQQIPELGAEEWTLSNGAKVVFKNVNYNKNQVALRAFSKGGNSLYNIEQLPSAIMLTNFANAYGLGNFNAIDLKKVLAGKKASANISLSELSENMSGSSSPEDVETMLKLIYLQFQHPRFDQDAHDAYLNRLRESIQNLKNDPNKIMQDSGSLILSNYHPRTLLMNEELLDNVHLDKIEQIYKERFKDASDFTFIIAGDIDAESVKPLVAKYIGSIPSEYRKENWVDNHVRGPKNVNKEIGIAFETAKSTSITIYRQTALPYTPENSIYQSVLAGVLDLKYTEIIREKEGGTYGVGVSPGASRDPFTVFSMNINFDCDPEKAAHLQSLVHKEIANVMAKGATQEELNKVTSNILKNRESSKLNNSYWMYALTTYYQMGYNPDDAKNYEDIIKNITPTTLQEFAKKMFSNADEINLIFKPKN